MLKKLSLLIFSVMLLTITQVALSADHRALLEGTDGKKHALNEFIGHGKWVVVNVWATACPYCRNELFDLNNFHNAHKDKDAMVLGLTLDYPSFDSPDKDYVADFAASYFVDYPLLMVSGEEASKVIGKPINIIPLSFFYNPAGKLVYRLNGMVTEKTLERIIRAQPSSYRTEWAEEVPPEYKPKSQ